MATKDLYENLIRYYEFQIGSMPRREKFKKALKETFSTGDLRIFFQLPYLGFIKEEKFIKKLAKIGIDEEGMQKALKLLIPKGLVDKFQKDGVWGYERAPVIVVLEMTVQDDEDSPFRQITAEVMNDLIEGAAETIPSRTPYYRVLPVEPTIQSESKSTVIEINAVIPDPRAILPIDVISEMLKKVDLIAISKCYCRSSKEIVGDACEHPLETCFYFDKLAQMKLQTEYAREVSYEEAMEILYKCETHGLIHNVSNCEGKIETLCNCCECSCGVLKAWNRGMRNTVSPSRFISSVDTEKCTLKQDCIQACPVEALSIQNEMLVVDEKKCLGCGLCVTTCSEGALQMIMREKPPKVFKDNDALFRNIYAESALGLIGRSLGIKNK